MLSTAHLETINNGFSVADYKRLSQPNLMVTRDMILTAIKNNNIDQLVALLANPNENFFSISQHAYQNLVNKITRLNDSCFFKANYKSAFLQTKELLLNILPSASEEMKFFINKLNLDYGFGFDLSTIIVDESKHSFYNDWHTCQYKTLMHDRLMMRMFGAYRADPKRKADHFLQRKLDDMLTSATLSAGMCFAISLAIALAGLALSNPVGLSVLLVLAGLNSLYMLGLGIATVWKNYKFEDIKQSSQLMHGPSKKFTEQRLINYTIERAKSQVPLDRCTADTFLQGVRLLWASSDQLNPNVIRTTNRIFEQFPNLDPEMQRCFTEEGYSKLDLKANSESLSSVYKPFLAL